MGLYKGTVVNGWEIDVLGTGDPDDLLVRQWPSLDFSRAPTEKETGIYPRKLNVPIVDREGLRGYISERLFDEVLTVELNLNGSLYFKGTSYSENRSRPIKQDEYDTSFIVSDGLDKLDGFLYDGETRTLSEFLTEILSKTGVTLPIDLYTDWEEDRAFGYLPDVHRITFGAVDDTYQQVLKKFCNDFGYQIFQEEGVWVVRSLAYYSQDSITKYRIGGTSSVVTTFADLGNTYKTSEIDNIKGNGSVRVTHSWDVQDGGIINGEFEEFSDGNFNGWDKKGNPTQVITQIGSEDVFSARLSDEADRLTQRFGRIVKETETVFIVINNFVQIPNPPSGPTDAVFAEIIFRNFTGDPYWLKNDGTVSGTQQFISQSVEANQFENEIELIFARNVKIDGNGFPANFSGTVDINLIYNDETDWSSFDFRTVRTSVKSESATFSRLISEASFSNLPIKTIELNHGQNNENYAGYEYEVLQGTTWFAAINYDGVEFSQKRAIDELSVRTTNLGVIKAEGDFSQYGGMLSLYAYEGSRYLPIASKIILGENDVTMYLFQNDKPAETFTLNRFFDNGDKSVSSTGTRSGSGTSQASGLSENEANTLYFRQDENLSEGNASTIRSNIGVEIGSDVQAFSARLDELSGLTEDQTSILLALDQDLTETSDVTFRDINGRSGVFSALLRGDTLRTDTGKFLSPVSYQFRNAGDTGFRDVEMANLNLNGALRSGSITSGFGSIDIGSSSLSAGAGTFDTGAGIFYIEALPSFSVTLRSTSALRIEANTNSAIQFSDTNIGEFARFQQGKLSVGTTALTEKIYSNEYIRADSGYKVATTTVIDSNRDALFRGLDVTLGAKFRDSIEFDKDITSDDFISGWTAEGGVGSRLSDDDFLEVDSMKIRGALFAQELIIDRTRSLMGNEIMSQAHGRIGSVESHVAGTITATSGNTTIEGNLADFTQNISIGDDIYAFNGGQIEFLGEVASISDDDFLDLADPANFTVSGSLYFINNLREKISLEDPDNINLNPFISGDLVWSQVFNPNSTSVIKRIVREVDSSTGVDVVLRTHASAPTDAGQLVSGDDIVQFGHLTDTTRQSIQYRTVQGGEPRWQLLDGIDSWTALSASDRIITEQGVLTADNTTGNGFYGSRAFFTDQFIVGDLTKTDTFIEYLDGQMRAKLDSLDIDAGEFNLEAGDDLDTRVMRISTEVVENDQEVLSNDFAGDETSVDVALNQSTFIFVEHDNGVGFDNTGGSNGYTAGFANEVPYRSFTRIKSETTLSSFDFRLNALTGGISDTQTVGIDAKLEFLDANDVWQDFPMELIQYYDAGFLEAPNVDSVIDGNVIRLLYSPPTTIASGSSQVVQLLSIEEWLVPFRAKGVRISFKRTADADLSDSVSYSADIVELPRLESTVYSRNYKNVIDPVRMATDDMFLRYLVRSDINRFPDSVNLVPVGGWYRDGDTIKIRLN